MKKFITDDEDEGVYEVKLNTGQHLFITLYWSDGDSTFLYEVTDKNGYVKTYYENDIHDKYEKLNQQLSYLTSLYISDNMCLITA